MRCYTLIIFTILLSFVSLLFVGCKGKSYSIDFSQIEKIKNPRSILLNGKSNVIEVNEVLCDSLFGKKGYKIVLTKFADTENEEINNSVFTLYKLINKQIVPIYTDSIYYKFYEMYFEDFNDDNVKDILIQMNSSARGNLTYHLYLTDIENETLKKIHGFDKIPNPVFLKDGIIKGWAVSGKGWTSFYEIDGDSISNFGITIYDDHSENSTFNDDFNKALREITNLREKVINKTLVPCQPKKTY